MRFAFCKEQTAQAKRNAFTLTHERRLRSSIDHERICLQGAVGDLEAVTDVDAFLDANEIEVNVRLP